MANKNKEHYNRDFYAWAIHNASLLREGKLSEIDIDNIAEEIESMGKSEKRELISRMAILIAHLLKWQLQPMRQSRSWKCAIEEQRFELSELLAESPSLKNELEKNLAHAYKRSLLIVEKETGMAKKVLPKTCPFSLKQIFNQKFFP